MAYSKVTIVTFYWSKWWKPRWPA